MTDIHWIKLSTDLFGNRKIKYLRRLPEGNALALIWVMLLTLAGKCSADGTIFLAEDMPYTPDMLAGELGFEESTVLSALDAFAKLGMIGETENGYLFITGWEEHQNLEKLEKIREQNKARKQRQRENEKLLFSSDNCHAESQRDCHAEENVTPHDCHAADKNREEENRTEEKREEKNTLSAAEPPKKKQAFVPPTVGEVREYCRQRKSNVDPVRFWEYFDTGGWKDSEGKPVRSWKQKLLTWETLSKENGGSVNERTADSSNGPSEWDNCYTFDGRKI